MVGGDDALYNSSPFNLATQGQRQPGSSFKPFVLAEALRQGISPASTWTSEKKHLHPQGRRALHGQQLRQRVRGRAHAGRRDDVLRQLRLRPGRACRSGPRRSPGWPAGWASARRSRTTWRSRSAASSRASRRSTWRTPTRRSPRAGSSPTGRCRPGYGQQRALPVPGPVGIDSIDPAHERQGQAGQGRRPRRWSTGVRQRRCSRRTSPATVCSILQTVVQQRHGREAQIPGVVIAGKTGTTEDYGDAWFVGWTQGVHRRGVGRLPGQVQADEDRVPGRARWPAARSRPASGRRSCSRC